MSSLCSCGLWAPRESWLLLEGPGIAKHGVGSIVAVVVKVLLSLRGEPSSPK